MKSQVNFHSYFPLLSGRDGTGKTSALKFTAIRWADNDEHLRRFDFVFSISLQDVSSDTNIENIIISQHTGLEGNKVQPEEIKAILDGETNSKVLVLIDNHKQYRGNSDIDRAIEKKSLWNCCVVLASRQSRHPLRQHMDEIVEICGLKEETIKRYLTKTLCDSEKSEEFLHQAESMGFGMKNSLFQNPLFLNMLCTSIEKIPKATQSRSGILQAILAKVIDREAIRMTGQKAPADVEQTVIKLGELAWEGLKNLDNMKLCFSKVNILNLKHN